MSEKTDIDFESKLDFIKLVTVSEASLEFHREIITRLRGDAWPIINRLVVSFNNCLKKVGEKKSTTDTGQTKMVILPADELKNYSRSLSDFKTAFSKFIKERDLFFKE